MDEQCRLCSMRRRPLIGIFSETGVKHQLKEKIIQRLHIFVNQGDFLPKSVCGYCCGKLDIFNQFVKDVHDTQISLLKQSTDKLNSQHPKIIKNEDIEIIEIEDDVQLVTRDCQSNEGNLNRGLFISSECYSGIMDRHSSSETATNIVNLEDKNSCIQIKTEPSVTSLESPKKRRPDDCETMSKNQITGKTPIKRLQSNLNSKPFLAKPRSTEHGTERRILRSNPKYYFFRRSISKNNCLGNSCSDSSDVGKRKEPKVPEEKRERRKSSIQIHKEEKTKDLKQRTDFSAQIGSTLLSDLKCLKNSLLLRKVNTKNATVFTIPVPVLPSANSANTTFSDSSTSKGCQTEILLGAKSSTRDTTVYQKISFEGRSFSEIGSESNAVITSPLRI